MAAQGSASNWPGGAYDPETHIAYLQSQSAVAALGLVPPDPGTADFKYHQGTVLAGPRRTGGSGSVTAAPREEGAGPGGAAPLTVQGLPLIKPPYGRLTAIDLNRGEILWQVPHGETPDSIRNHAVLKGMTIPRTGRPGNVGTLVTKTLVIVGDPGFQTVRSGQRGGVLRAYEKASGKEVGAISMPAPQSGSPMTYMLNGRQYLVLAISGAAYSGELIAFALPARPQSDAR
jgi:quinoprotein glucose dehydrogenase